MKNLLIRYFKDDNGQTSTEYILLVAVVAIIVFKFGKTAKERLLGLTGKIFDNADSMIGSGLE